MNQVDGKFWINRWESNEIGFHRDKPNYFLTKYFEQLNLNQAPKVLVPLCGKSLDMLWLADIGCSVIGCELSNLACQQFYNENFLEYTLTETDKFIHYGGTDISIYCGDFFLVTEMDLGSIDFCYDRAAMVALPKQLRTNYAKKLTELLPTGAKYLLEIKTYQCHSEIGPPFSVTKDEVNELFSESFSIEFLEEQSEMILSNSNIKLHGANELINTACLLIRK